MPNYNNYSGGRSNGGKSYQQKGNNSKVQLPQGYLAGGYYDGEGEERVLKKEYIVRYSKEIASGLEKEGGRSKNKRSQIRKYYAYCLRIQRILQQKKAPFDEVEAKLDFLSPLVSYAYSRGKTSELFKSFIEKNLSQIHSKEELNAFIMHFEAVVAYLPKE